MRTALALFCIASLFYFSPAGAEEATGRVRGVYYEASRGVLVDASMLRRPSAIRWADVELDGDHAPDRKRQLVQMPADMTVLVGDMVALRLGESKSTQLASVLPTVAQNRAFAVNPQEPRFAGSASTGASKVK